VKRALVLATVSIACREAGPQGWTHRDALETAPVDATPVIIEDGHDNDVDSIDIAVGPGRALSLWRDWNLSGEAYAALLGPDAEPQGPTIQLSAIGDEASGPMAAWDGQRWLVVWDECHSLTVHGRFVDPEGVPGPELVWPAPSSCGLNSVAVGGGGYVVTSSTLTARTTLWVDMDGGAVAVLDGGVGDPLAFDGVHFLEAAFNLSGAGSASWLVNPDGTLARDAGLAVNPQVALGTRISAAATNPGFVVAYASDAPTINVYVVRFDGSGQALDDPAIQLTPVPLGPGSYPSKAVVAGVDSALVLWSSAGLYGRRIALSTGALLDPAPVLVSPDCGLLAAANEGDRVWISCSVPSGRVGSIVAALDGGIQSIRASRSPYRIAPSVVPISLEWVNDRAWLGWVREDDDGGLLAAASTFDADGGALERGLALPFSPPIFAVAYSGDTGVAWTIGADAGTVFVGFDAATRMRRFATEVAASPIGHALAGSSRGVEALWFDATTSTVEWTHLDLDGGANTVPIKQSLDAGPTGYAQAAVCGDQLVFSWGEGLMPTAVVWRSAPDGGAPLVFERAGVFAADMVCGPGVQLAVLHPVDNSDLQLALLRDGDRAPQQLGATLPASVFVTAGAFDGVAWQVLVRAGDLHLVEVALDGGTTDRLFRANPHLGSGLFAASPGSGRTLLAWSEFVALPDAGNTRPLVAEWVSSPEGAPCAVDGECRAGACRAGVCCTSCTTRSDAGPLEPDAGPRAPWVLAVRCASTGSTLAVLAAVALLLRLRRR
jgi:hypothetical protein